MRVFPPVFSSALVVQADLLLRVSSRGLDGDGDALPVPECLRDSSQVRTSSYKSDVNLLPTEGSIDVLALCPVFNPSRVGSTDRNDLRCGGPNPLTESPCACPQGNDVTIGTRDVSAC